MKKITSTILLFLFFIASKAQQKNFAVINPGDSQSTVIRKAAMVVPSPRQLRWQQLELTAFFHFGVNTFTNREWGTGKESTEVFNPVHLDANQWVRVVKAAGIKQVILTAKHHDGFCLWPTKFTAHSVKNSPWKNGRGDVVKELSEACKKYNIGFGIYLSPWDRNQPVYGTDKYNDYFVDQLTELLTNYGRIDEVWFDGANGEGPGGKKYVYDFDRWYKLIRTLQPSATIAVTGPDVRWVGTESGYGRQTEWSVVPATNLDAAAIAKNSQQAIAFKPQGDMMGDDLGSRDKIKDAKLLVWYPAETDVSIRPGWFYHPEEDSLVKTPEKLMDIYFNSVGENSVLLLNIPPDKDGLINKADVESLEGFHKLMEETFSVNLANGAGIKVEGGINESALLDNSYATCYMAAEKDTTPVIEFDLVGTKTFDVVMLQEAITFGQRIEKFTVEYYNGNEWKRVTDGTTVGYKRLLRFAPVTADKVRLRIQSSRLNPAIAAFGLYKEATAK